MRIPIITGNAGMANVVIRPGSSVWGLGPYGFTNMSFMTVATAGPTFWFDATTISTPGPFSDIQGDI